jgi:hypothetical protein
MKLRLPGLLSFLVLLTLLSVPFNPFAFGPAPAYAVDLNFKLPDTGQYICYDNEKELACPAASQPFFGQDGNFYGTQPTYRDNGNGTITELLRNWYINTLTC